MQFVFINKQFTFIKKKLPFEYKNPHAAVRFYNRKLTPCCINGQDVYSEGNNWKGTIYLKTSLYKVLMHLQTSQYCYN